jgi:phosphatidylglycerol---prolipoprotein diacylglyceryl transferase
MLFAIPLPVIDPVMLNIGPLRIHWYGMAYVIGILLSWGWIRHLLKKYPNGILPNHIDDCLTYLVLGILFGGRLGHVFLYAPFYYWEHPLEIVMVWKGGMSFHGAFVGVLMALFWYCRKIKVSYLRFLDVLSFGTPLGLFFGRLANFINQEHYGRVTDVPWAMIFPFSDGLPRHPSQLYEALLEGFFLFIIASWLWSRPKWRETPGKMSGVFLFGYGMTRSFCEFFREPEIAILLLSPLTWGQILSLPMIMIGWFLIRRPSWHHV